MAKNKEGEWKTKVLKSIEISETLAWQLQKSISPDGKTFLGVRKVAKTQKGETKFTNAGFSLLAESRKSVQAELEAIHKLVGVALKKVKGE